MSVLPAQTLAIALQLPTRIRMVAAALSAGGDRTGEGERRLPGAEFDALIEIGAYESAVLSLLGDETAFILSRGAHGRCLATLVDPTSGAELSGHGKTPVWALLMALERLSSVKTERGHGAARLGMKGAAIH